MERTKILDPKRVVIRHSTIKVTYKKTWMGRLCSLSVGEVVFLVPVCAGVTSVGVGPFV